MVDNVRVQGAGEVSFWRFACEPSQEPEHAIYLAPEVAAGGECTAASDVFAFGVVAYFVIFTDLPERDTVESSTSGLNCSSSLRKMLAKCWNSDPSGRPSFPEIIRLL